tara:strand:- start:2063 stop:2254 length:192 start_codon:yes stop_codon:yes gene_type:complete
MSTLSEKIEAAKTEINEKVAEANKAREYANNLEREALVLSGKLQALNELQVEEENPTVTPEVA